MLDSEPSDPLAEASADILGGSPSAEKNKARKAYDPIETIKKHAERFGVPVDLALKVAKQESGGHEFRSGGKVVTSEKGAQGALQVLPETAEAEGFNPNDPEGRTLAGLSYLGKSLKRWNGDPVLALMGYHGGIDDAEKILRNPKGNPKGHAYARAIVPDEYAKRTGSGDQPRGAAETSPLDLASHDILSPKAKAAATDRAITPAAAAQDPLAQATADILGGGSAPTSHTGPAALSPAGEPPVPDHIFAEDIPAYAQQYFGGDELKASTYLQTKGSVMDHTADLKPSPKQQPEAAQTAKPKSKADLRRQILAERQRNQQKAGAYQTAVEGITKELESLAQNREKLIAAGYGKDPESMKSIDDAIYRRARERSQLQREIENVKSGKAPKLAELKNQLADIEKARAVTLHAGVAAKDDDERENFYAAANQQNDRAQMLKKYIDAEESGQIAHPALRDAALRPVKQEEKLPWYLRGVTANVAHTLLSVPVEIEHMALFAERSAGITPKQGDPGTETVGFEEHVRRAEEGLNEIASRGGSGFGPDAQRILGNVIAHLPMYAGIGKLAGAIGPSTEAAAFGLVGASEVGGRAEQPELKEIGKNFATSALMVPVFKSAGLIPNRTLRMAAAGAGGAGVTAAFGGNVQDILTSGVITGIFAAPGGSKSPYALNENKPPSYMEPILDDMANMLVKDHGYSPEVAKESIGNMWRSYVRGAEEAGIDPREIRKRGRAAMDEYMKSRQAEAAKAATREPLGPERQLSEEGVKPDADQGRKSATVRGEAAPRAQQGKTPQAQPRGTKGAESAEAAQTEIGKRYPVGFDKVTGEPVYGTQEEFYAERKGTSVQREAGSAGAARSGEREGAGRPGEGSGVDRVRDGKREQKQGQEEIAVGDSVSHPRFGKGKPMEVTKVSPDGTLELAFTRGDGKVIKLVARKGSDLYNDLKKGGKPDEGQRDEARTAEVGAQAGADEALARRGTREEGSGDARKTDQGQRSLRVEGEGSVGKQAAEPATKASTSDIESARTGGGQARTDARAETLSQGEASWHIDRRTADSAVTEVPEPKGGVRAVVSLPVMSRVLRALHDPKVRNVVIKSVPVNVVNDLLTAQSASKVSLHNESMLKDASVVGADSAVSLRSDVARSLIKTIADLSAEVSGADLRGGSRDLSAALVTGKIGRHGAEPPSRSTVSGAPDSPSGAPPIITEYPQKAGRIVAQGEARVPGAEGIVKRAKEAERRAAQEGATDKLTGLQSQSQWEGARTRIDADPSTHVARLDFNDLKATNDQHGHAAGDAYIRKAGKIVREEIAKAGLSERGTFRTGGDELTVTGPREAVEKATAEIKRRVAEEIDLPTGAKGSVATGVALTDAEADTAMYADKKAMKAEAAERAKALPDVKTRITQEHLSALEERLPKMDAAEKARTHERLLAEEREHAKAGEKLARRCAETGGRFSLRGEASL